MPTINIPDRICPHCGGTRWKTETRKKPTKANPDKRTIRYRCAKKSQEREKRWVEKNFDKMQEYWKKRKDRLRESGHWKLPEMKERYRLKAKKERSILPDHFVRNLIVQTHNKRNDIKLSSSDVSKELVELRRKQMLLTRQIKNYGKSN